MPTSTTPSRAFRTLGRSLAALALLLPLAAFTPTENIFAPSADLWDRWQRHDPQSELTPRVTARLNSLAENLYGEAILYQRVGDHAKALERIHAILTEAPLSPAAAKLRSKAVLES